MNGSGDLYRIWVYLSETPLLWLTLTLTAFVIGDAVSARFRRNPLASPVVIAAGLLMMLLIDPVDSYVTSILPAVIVFGARLTLVVAPVTATVLAAADERHSGMASGINNAVARVAGLLAVAGLPLVAGLTGDKFYDPAAMEDGFRMAMVACAALAALGGILAWLTISSDVLEAEPATREFFGSEFITAYTRMRRYELSRVADHVSDWERMEYLELF